MVISDWVRTMNLRPDPEGDCLSAEEFRNLEAGILAGNRASHAEKCPVCRQLLDLRLVTRYKTALKKHGTHADGCAYVPSDGIYPSYGECDCGWKELSKEIERT